MGAASVSTTGNYLCTTCDDGVSSFVKVTLHSQKKYFGGRRTLRIYFSNLHLKHPGKRYKKNSKILTSEEQRVSQNKTFFKIFFAFFSLFVLFLLSLWQYLWKEKDVKRTTTTQNATVGTTTLRRKDTPSRDSSLSLKYLLHPLVYLKHCKNRQQLSK